MKINRNFTFLVFLALLTASGFAQSDVDINKRTSIRDRIYTGGGLGAGFGNVTWVQLSPVVGYMITNDFSAGVGIQYRYSSYKQFNPKVSTNDFGTNLFARYNIKEPFFAQIEYEYLNYQLLQIVRNELVKTRKGNNALLVGGGMSQPVGRRAFFNISAFYNLLYNPGDRTSPYSSPFVLRAGVSLGI